MITPTPRAERWLDVHLAPGEQLHPVLGARSDVATLSHEGWRVASALLRSGHARGTRIVTVHLVLDPRD